MQINEGVHCFDFASDTTIKFDGTAYYQKYKNCMGGNKGVDILTYKNHELCFIEIKDFTGYESDPGNIRRFKINSPECETIDCEIALKVKSTIAAIVGGYLADEANIKPFFDCLTDAVKPSIKVIAFLEGDISRLVRKKSCARETAFKEIKRSIKKQLKWLNASVSIECCSYHPNTSLYTVTRQ